MCDQQGARRACVQALAEAGVHVVINLLPGPLRDRPVARHARTAAKAKGLSYDEAYAHRRGANPARCFGRPEEFGAFLAGDQACFVPGENIVMDGGAYLGTL